MTFNFHDKRITLNLALHSNVCSQNPELMNALNQLPGLGWDVYKLPKTDLEAIYAEFDNDLEAKIRDEFQADPSYLVDMAKHGGDAECPLCGHKHIRWLFNIMNTAGGSDVKCGSKCILDHGIHVKGSETAEHARKALQAAITRQIRQYKLDDWHAETGFNADMLKTLEKALERVRYAFGYGQPHAKAAGYHQAFKIRQKASFMAYKDLPKLVRFYERSGWLGTEKRWAEWTRLVGFARKFDEQVRSEIAYPAPFGQKAVPEKKQTPVAPKVAPVVEMIAPAPVVTQSKNKFGQLSMNLVFGK